MLHPRSITNQDIDGAVIGMMYSEQHIMASIRYIFASGEWYTYQAGLGSYTQRIEHNA